MATVTKKEWYFRPLENGETRPFIIRHFEHEGNITPPEELDKAMKQGKKLAEAGIKLSALCSSPFARAVDAVLWTARGMGRMPQLFTVRELGDFTLEGEELKIALKKAAKEAGVPIEEFLFDERARKAIPDIESIMIRRATEGTDALRVIAADHVGMTVLVGSHGASRIEISIQRLLDDNPRFEKPSVFLERGQIAEVIMFDGKAVEVNYLPLGWEE